MRHLCTAVKTWHSQNKNKQKNKGRKGRCPEAKQLPASPFSGCVNGFTQANPFNPLNLSVLTCKAGHAKHSSLGWCGARTGPCA